MAASQGKSYVITAEQHALRAAFAAFTWAIMLGVAYLVAEMFFDEFMWVYCATFAVWTLMIGESMRYFLVGVPEVTGLIAINMLQHPKEDDPYYNQIVFPTGLWLKFPWEQVKDDLYINLRMVTQEYEEDFPAKDGPKIPIRGVILYRPDERLLPRYVAVDSSVINRGLVDIVTGALSQKIARHLARRARGKVDEYQQLLLNRFESGLVEIQPGSHEALIAQAQEVTQITFEWLFAIDFIGVRIGDADYDEQYQTALANQARSELIDDLVKQLIGERRLDPKDAMNVALLQYGINNVDKQIIELEGDAHQALAALIARWGRSTSN